MMMIMILLLISCFCVNFSSAAEIHFNSSINHATCILFGDLDFTNSTSDSWPDITATCIEGSSDLSTLPRMTVSGQGRPLTAAQCQTYTDQQSMQCRMDCLLTFMIVIPNYGEKPGYIHLRNISCNQTLFTASINTVFNNANNIQPSFTPRFVEDYNTLSGVCIVLCTVIILSYLTAYHVFTFSTTHNITIHVFICCWCDYCYTNNFILSTIL